MTIRRDMHLVFFDVYIAAGFAIDIFMEEI